VAGNAGPVTNGTPIVIDSKQPTAQLSQTGGNYFSIAANDTGKIVLSDGLTTDDTNITLHGTYTGTLADGTAAGVSKEFIEVNFGDGSGWHTATASGGTWTFNTAAPPGITLTLGTHYTVQVRLDDVAGNVGFTASNTVNVANLSGAMATITSIDPNTGSSFAPDVFNTGDVTAKGALTDASGAPVTLGSNQVVEYNILNAAGTSVSNGWTQATAVTGSAWSADMNGVLSSLKDGAYTVEARVTTLGNPGTVLSHSITLDTTPPTQAVSIDGLSPDTGVQGDWATSNGLVILSGTLSAALNSTLNGGNSPETLYITIDGSTPVAVTGVSGTAWSYTVSGALDEGAHNVKVYVEDQAGNMGNAVSKTVTIDNTPPAENVSINAVSPDSYGTWASGTDPAASDFITNPGSSVLVLSGTLSGSLQTGEAVQISLDGGKTWNQVTPTVTGTSWTAVLPTTLGEGSHDVVAQVVSVTGVAGAQDDKTLVIDTTQPLETVQISTVGGQNVTGGTIYTADNGSSGAPLTITGTISNALNSNGGSTEMLQISLDNGSTWNQVTGFTSTTAWSYTAPSQLPDGGVTVMARVVDVAGNIGAGSASQPVVIAHNPPAQTADIEYIKPDTDSVAPNPVYGNGTDYITSTTLGGGSGSGSLTIGGTTSAVNPGDGSQVQVSFDGTHWATATWSGNNWSYATTATSGDASGYNGAGTYANVQVRVMNAASVAGTPANAPAPIVVDNTAPTETATLAQITDGTVTAINEGGGAWLCATGTNLTLSGSLSGQLASGAASGVSAETLWINLGDGNGWHQVTNVSGTTWSYANVTLADNSGGTPYNIQLMVVDLAGNLGPLPVTPIQLTVATTPTETPSISTVSPDTLMSDGSYGANNDYVTSTNGTSGNLTVTGTLDHQLLSTEKVQVALVSSGGTVKWVDATTTGTDWTASVPAATDGTYTLKVQVVNSVGGANPGPDFGHQVTIDSTAWAGTESFTSITAPAGSQGSGWTTSATTGVTIYGILGAPLDNGAYSPALSIEQLQISVNGGAWTAVNTSTLTTSGQWNYTLPTLVNGDNTVQTRVVDLAGNVSATSSQTITVATPPVVTNFTLSMVHDGGDDGASTTDSITSVPTPNFTGSFSSSDPTTQAEMAAGKLTVTLYIDTNGNGLPDAGDQILATGVQVSSGGTFTTTNINALASGQSYTVNAAVENGDHIYSTSASTQVQITANTVAVTSSVATAYAGLGYSMTQVGDFNGDGYADYIVTAPGDHNGNQLGAGTSTMYLLYGGPNGLPNISNLSATTITAAQGIRITSTNTDDRGLQGMTVTDIGDMNGDGLDDVAIASNLNDRVYVLYGQKNASSAINLNALTAGQGISVYTPNHNGSYFGQSVAGADLNGDGYSDLLVGYLYNGNALGDVFVIYGGPNAQSATTPISIGGTTGTMTVTGAANNYTILYGTNGMSTNMQAVGAVNGDGYTDYIVTMPGGAAMANTMAGTAYLIFGGPSGITSGTTVTAAQLSAMTPSQGILITASGAYEHLGGQARAGANQQNADAYYAQYHAVASLGNIDGTGRNAFAIGSPGAIGPFTTTGEGAGAVYVMYGASNWLNITLPTWNATSKTWSSLGDLDGTKGFVIYSSVFAGVANGTLPYASDLGFSISSAGDVNGDGFNDFLIGAPAANNGRGAVFLVFGAAGGLPGANTGVVDLDALVSKAAGQFGVAGTAVEYNGTMDNTAAGGSTAGGSMMGTDVTGGDFSGTGIDGYSFSAWGMATTNVSTGTGTVVQAGQNYIYNGTTAYLTQPYNNADHSVYYAGVQGVGSATISQGVDIIATGQGNNDWVHGIGTDTTGSTLTGVQHDSVSGGVGNDFIGIIGTSFTSLNGGEGANTLVFENSGLTLNLTQMGLRVQSFGTFDLNNQSNTAATDPGIAGDPNHLAGQFVGTTTHNTLQLSLSDILTENGAPGPLNDANTTHIMVLGDSSSTVVLDNTNSLTSSNWTQLASTQAVVNGVSFDVYQNNLNHVAELLVQHGVGINVI
jgi:hypothetical protein